MSKPSESRFRDRYDRPNTGWVCGRLAEGCPCAAGPDSRGRCTTPTVCVPKQDKDRWTCTRSPLLGGSCDNGPLPDGTCCQSAGPCRPTRDLRSKRKRFALCSVVLVVGVLMIGVSGPSRDDFLSPGELSSSHARLVADQGCISCHDAAEHRVGGWVGSWLGFHSTNGDLGTSPNKLGDVQNEKCIACHRDRLDSHWASSPHGVDPDWLAIKTNGRRSGRSSFSELVHGSGSLADRIACSTCHREHHGSESDLSALTDRQCQTCHADSFNSFGVGHPDFGDWPYQRRTRIAFDHASHSNRHFPDRKASFNCNQCHSQSDSLESMELAGFEQSCASCHQDSIRESAADGIALLMLPSVDIEMLAIHGYDVGPWPVQASGYFDGSIPPLMQLLLAADEDAASAMSQLGPNVDFSMVNEDDPQQIAAVGVIALAIKKLVADLSADGSEAMVRRMSISLGRNIDNKELAATRTRTPTSMFGAIQSSWFPEDGNANVSLPQFRNESRSRDALVAYVGQTELVQRTSRFAVDQETESEWLAENPLRGFAGVENGRNDVASDPMELSTDTDSVQDPPTQAEVQPTPSVEPDSLTRESDPTDIGTEAQRIESYRFLSSGVWEYDDQRWVLEYHVHGHADAFLAEWIELLQTTHFPGTDTLGARVAEYFASDVAPGRCTDCHSIDQQIDNLSLPDSDWRSSSDLAAKLVNWRAKQPDSSVRGFTRFSHRPHLIQPELSNCEACHSIDSDADYHTNYENENPQQFHSGFDALGKATCVNCHQPQRASDRCTTCHNYHVQSHAAGSTW